MEQAFSIIQQLLLQSPGVSLLSLKCRTFNVETCSVTEHKVQQLHGTTSDTAAITLPLHHTQFFFSSCTSALLSRRSSAPFSGDTHPETVDRFVVIVGEVEKHAQAALDVGIGVARGQSGRFHE